MYTKIIKREIHLALFALSHLKFYLPIIRQSIRCKPNKFIEFCVVVRPSPTLNAFHVLFLVKNEKIAIEQYLNKYT